MAKEKTMVVGCLVGLAGLAHNAQRGSDTPSATNNDENVAAEEAKEAEEAAAAEAERMAAEQAATEEAAKKEGWKQGSSAACSGWKLTRHAAQTAQNDVKDHYSTSCKEAPKGWRTTVGTWIYDSKRQWWSRLATVPRPSLGTIKHVILGLRTVYIDSDLKSVLDRLEVGIGIKLPSTSTCFSAIVARFVSTTRRILRTPSWWESVVKRCVWRCRKQCEISLHCLQKLNSRGGVWRCRKQ